MLLEILSPGSCPFASATEASTVQAPFGVCFRIRLRPCSIYRRQRCGGGLSPRTAQTSSVSAGWSRRRNHFNERQAPIHNAGATAPARCNGILDAVFAYEAGELVHEPGERGDTLTVVNASPSQREAGGGHLASGARKRCASCVPVFAAPPSPLAHHGPNLHRFHQLHRLTRCNTNLVQRRPKRNWDSSTSPTISFFRAGRRVPITATALSPSLSVPSLCRTGGYRPCDGLV